MDILRRNKISESQKPICESLSVNDPDLQWPILGLNFYPGASKQIGSLAFVQSTIMKYLFQ